MASGGNYRRGLEFLEPFQQPKPDWLEEIRQLGVAYKVPIIDDDMGRFLRLICSLKRPQTILEIGCGISYSTHWMLLGCPEAKVVGIDYNQQRLDFCHQFLSQSGYLPNVTLKRIWAADFFESNQQRFDVIFQDSTKKEYVEMIEGCYQCLNPGGLLIVDNIFYNGKAFGVSEEQQKKYGKAVQELERFNKEISSHSGFDCHYFAISDGALVAQRK